MGGIAELVGRPIRLTANPVLRFYRGGARWRSFRGIDPAFDTEWAEDWVASCIPASADTGPNAEGLSTLAADPDLTLRALIEAHPREMLGEASLRRWGPNPMVQVKLVAPRDRVPLHIHPGASFAQRHHGSACGKAEAWILVDAAGSGGTAAHCGVGLREGVTRNVFVDAVGRQDREALLASVHQGALQPGDVVFIAPGIPHYISGGTFFVEVQEPADLGYLVEWHGFVEDAGAATGGLGMELALEALDATGTDRETAWRRAFQVPTVVRKTAGSRETRLMGAEARTFFEATRLEVTAVDTPPAGRYHVVVVVRGAGWIEGRFGHVGIRAGDTLVMPATLDHSYRAGPDGLEVLRCFGPAIDDA